MDQTTLAQRDELASEHQLGRLEMQRTPRTFKAWALFFGGILAGCFLLSIAVVYFSGLSFIEGFSWALAIDDAIFAISLFGLLFLPAIVRSFTCSTVYIYTNGLVYLKDGTRISFISIYTSRGSARLSTLHTFIRERVPQLTCVLAIAERAVSPALCARDTLMSD